MDVNACCRARKRNKEGQEDGGDGRGGWAEARERETREICQGAAGPVRLNLSVRYNWIDAAVRTVHARKNINDQ